jgi:hypothetical protein
MEDHPERQAIRRLIERVRVAESFWRASESQGVEQGPIRLDTLPVGLPIPEGLVEAITSDRNLPNRKCRREGDCAVLGVDLDRDGHLEYCLLGGSDWWYSACYSDRRGQAWEAIGSLVYRGPGSRPSRQELEAGLAIGPVATRTPTYDDLAVPEGVLELVPPDPSHIPD